MENRENDTEFHKTGQQKYPKQNNEYIYKTWSCRRWHTNNCNGCFVITAKSNSNREDTGSVILLSFDIYTVILMFSIKKKCIIASTLTRHSYLDVKKGLAINMGHNENKIYTNLFKLLFMILAGATLPQSRIRKLSMRKQPMTTCSLIRTACLNSKLHSRRKRSSWLKALKWERSLNFFP